MTLLALALACLVQPPADTPLPPGLVAAASDDALPDLADLARLGLPGAPGGVAGRVAVAEPAEYVVEAAARSRVVYLLPPGPRTVRELSVEPGPQTAEAWRLATLRLTWESDNPDAGAAVDVPLGLLFGRVAPDSGLGPTLLAGSAGATWVCRFPMPYRAQGVLEIRTEQPLAGRLRIRSTPGEAPGSGYFRGASWSGPARLSDEGRGQVAGLFVVGPARLGRLVLDGRPLGPLGEAVGLKGDDRTPAAALVRGFLRAGDTGPTASYRWLAARPLAYDRALTVEDDAGQAPEAAGPGTSAAALFWYSERPRPGPAPAAEPPRRSP